MSKLINIYIPVKTKIDKNIIKTTKITFNKLIFLLIKIPKISKNPEMRHGSYKTKSEYFINEFLFKYNNQSIKKAQISLSMIAHRNNCNQNWRTD